MGNELEPKKFTRRKLLSAVGAGVAMGITGGILFPSREQATDSAASPTPSPTQSELQTPSQTVKPTESPSPSPSPEVKVGELPDILSSKDKDWQNYFIKETNLGRLNDLIRQQQATENTKAQAEGRQPSIICSFLFDPTVTANLGTWTIRKIMAGNPSAITYSFLLPSGATVKAPFEGNMDQRGFSNGGSSLDIIGKNGYLFWNAYFGSIEFDQRKVVAGEGLFTTTKGTQTFTKFGNIDMKSNTTIYSIVLKDPSSPFSIIKWLTNEKGQIIYS